MLNFGFVDDIPDSFAKLRKLRVLYTVSNGIGLTDSTFGREFDESGVISQLPNLMKLDMGGCGLTGTIPSSINSMPVLNLL